MAVTTRQGLIDYCQALRDITTQSEFPFKIEWPKAPSSE